MIDMSATAFSRFLRARAAASRSPLPDRASVSYTHLTLPTKA